MSSKCRPLSPAGFRSIFFVLGIGIGFVGIDAWRLPPAAGEEGVGSSRRRQIAADLAEGTRLVAYLDCGAEKETPPDDPIRITLRQGGSWTYKSDEPSHAAADLSVAFDARRVIFDLEKLDAAKKYTCYFTWWDFDADERMESVFVASADNQRVRPLLLSRLLPNYQSDHQPAEQKQVVLPGELIQDGKLTLMFQNVSGTNAVVGELWIVQQ